MSLTNEEKESIQAQYREVIGAQINTAMDNMIAATLLGIEYEDYMCLLDVLPDKTALKSSVDFKKLVEEYPEAFV